MVLALSLALSPACATKKKSALEELEANYNPIEAMRLPEKKGPEKSGPAIEITTGESETSHTASSTDRSPDPLLDQKQLSKIPDQPVSRRVKISGSHVPLRRGPGTQFKKVGTGSKGDIFKLLSIQRNSGDTGAWYLVQDQHNKRFFVSELVSSIIEDEVKPAGKKTAKKKKVALNKEIVQKRQKVSSRKYRSIFDPTPPLPKSLRQAKHITLNFEGTDVYDVITTFCELLQIDYLIEGNIKGKVTLQTFNKIPVKDLYAVLEQIIALNNITVAKSGNFYRFLPIKDAAKKPLSIFYDSDPLIPNKERMIIQIIPLKFISVASMKKILAPLLSPNANFLEVPETNNLMLIEMAPNVKRVLKVVKALDIDKLASSDIQLYRLQNADANTVVDELQEIFSSMGYSDALGKSISFLSLGRINSVLVVNAFESILPTIEFWIGKLDQPISEGVVSTFVYYVQNADAITLADLLNAMFQSHSASSPQPGKPFETKKAPGNKPYPLNNKTASPAKKTPSPTPKSKGLVIQTRGGIDDKVEGTVTIIADKDTNSLIIRTNPRNHPAILELIKKLDLLPQQVLIEVLIIDLTLDAETRAGLQWALKGSKGNTTYAGGIETGSTLGSKIGTATAVFLPGGSFFVGEPDKFITLLEAFARDSKANVLANPILVTADNKSANISVADEIPIESSVISQQTASQPLVSSTIQFRSVGIKLEITPKINSDNYVHLKISQEISNRGPDVNTGTTTTPSFNTRLLNTEVILKDNQVLVMGGLMRTDSVTSNTGAPILRKIPFLGKLFGTDIDSTTKTELMIFITPHVISTQEDSEFVTKKFQKRLGYFKKSLEPS